MSSAGVAPEMAHAVAWVWAIGVVGLAPLIGAARLPSASRRPARYAQGDVRFNRVAAVVAFVACLVLLGWPWSLVAAVVGSFTAWHVVPAQLSSIAADRDLAIARELPEVADLLAALLRTGMPDGAALARVSPTVAEPVGPLLQSVARHRLMGASPRAAWAAVLDEPALAQLAQVMVRHADTGAGVAAALDRVAADARRDYFSRAQAAARAAAVKAVIPLAVCFLPAFFLLGVAPIVASLFAGLHF